MGKRFIIMDKNFRVYKHERYIRRIIFTLFMMKQIKLALKKRELAKVQKNLDELSFKKYMLEQEIEFLSSEKTEIEKVTISKPTEKVEQETKQMTKDEVSKKFGNKIIFKTNTKNSNLHADKGNIDEFIEYAKTTKHFEVRTKNGKTRVFHNYKKLNGLAIEHARDNGWEISQQ